jgi:predicted ATP-dependent endonuclease of OLD family
MTILIPSLAIAGYRSFGKTPQYFDSFSKINLLIGRNNAGKSNVIRFLDDIYPKKNKTNRDSNSSLIRHLLEPSQGLIGKIEVLSESNPGIFLINDNFHLLERFPNEYQRKPNQEALSKIFTHKKKLENTNSAWIFFTYPYSKKIHANGWKEALQALTNHELERLWCNLFNSSGGDRNHWEQQIIATIGSDIEPVNIEVIPAIRQIGAKGTISNEFDGNGIIDRLAKLQNPDVDNQHDKQKFLQITNFLRSVLDNANAEIEVPHDRNTINVHMDGKTLPLESLGTGIHEVIILATAATILADHVLCIEEPELHLNPILQKKFIRYLSDFTSNQYFISTHSPALMDTPKVEIYHIKLESGASIVERVTTNSQRSLVCEDLGYHPSDLLQANSIIWVEGPSDRVYLNFWLKSAEPKFIEGVHYSIMFYGGKLASHLTYQEDTHDINDFISLRKLNRRGVMILDSDRDKKSARINNTKQRLRDEFNQGPGHTWITEGREIENYLPVDQIKKAISAITPSSTLLSNFEKYDNFLKIKTKSGKEIQASKVDVARQVAKNNQPDFSTYDLKQRITKLVQFIRESNPKFEIQ